MPSDAERARMEVRLDRLEQSVSTLEHDVSVLKQDVSVLKQDVSVLKQDVSVLKQDVSVIKRDLSNLTSRFDVSLDEMREGFKRQAELTAALGERMERGFAEIHRQRDSDMAFLRTILGNHERRISDLENAQPH